MLSSHRGQDPVIAAQQYAVVLVNEEQLDQLMGRPSVRRVNSRFGPQDVYARYQRLKRQMMAGAVVLLVLAAGALWFLAPQPVLASMFPWSGASAVPALPTGASFSVTIASLQSGDAAAMAAARVRGLGLPAFTRRSPGKRQVYQAMVGPYASLDEAERTQRRLGGLGYSGAWLFVDESLRGASDAGHPEVSKGNPNVLLLGAPDRLSIVLELPSEPRQVKSDRSTQAALLIEAGPMPNPVQAQQWRAPEGVDLVDTVSIDGATAQGGGQHVLRALVALPDFAKANIRTEGRRVYVDLTRPLAEEDARTPRRLVDAPAATADQRAGAREKGAAVSEQGSGNGDQVQGTKQEEQYREAIAPLHERIAEVRPFLLSGAQSGSVEVLAAIDQTLATLEESLVSMNVPLAEAGQHQLLLSATRVARRGLEPGFTGDRVAHAQKAIDMFDGAMAIATTPAAQ